MTQKALKLALEGVEIHSPNSPEYIVCAALIEALRENAMREVQEPVACQYAKDVAMFEYRCVGRCQYDTSPPEQRTWVGLTDEEIKPCWHEACQTELELTSQLVVYFAKAIEAKLKEKNT